VKSAVADGTLGTDAKTPDRPVGPDERFCLIQLQLLSIMSHTYCSALFHCVFSTKERRKLIAPQIQERLWAYIGGVAKEHGLKALAIGGTGDHIHILLSLPSSFPIANAMREIKSASSFWMRRTGARADFEWQEGYGAFSIGFSQITTTSAYIKKQEEHHRKRDFQAEFIAFLKKHRVEYDPRYLWG
jgi:REP element-mobilizing transposase RayT